MHFHGEDVSAVKGVFFGVRVVGHDPFDEFELPDHVTEYRRAKSRVEAARTAPASIPPRARVQRR